MLSWWLTAALDPDFRLIQYFFLSNTEDGEADNRPSYGDGRLCSSFLLVTCVPCLPDVIQNQSGDSRLGQECFVIG